MFTTRILLFFTVFSVASLATGTIVPSDYFATPENILDINSYDEVVVTNTWSSYYGTIEWEGGASFDLGRIWFLDEDMKPCGVFDIASAVTYYGFLHCYGDDILTTEIDEGAISGDELSVVIDTLDGNIYHGNFVGGPPVWQSTLDVHRIDIVVDTVPIPEPVTVLLFSAGALAMMRHRKMHGQLKI